MEPKKCSTATYTPAASIIPAKRYSDNHPLLNPENNYLVFVLFDGLQNSVFSSQVLQPLLDRLSKEPHLEITLISFEKHRIPYQVLTEIIPAHDRFHLILGDKLSFFGKTTLYYSAYGLYKILKEIPCNRIMARGPLAGWITLYALNRLEQKHHFSMEPLNSDAIGNFLIQARGLCAEEYRFQSQFTRSNILKRYFQKFRYNQLLAIEKEIYNKNIIAPAHLPVNIESVSPALSDYLIKYFHADPKRITIATLDIPDFFAPEQIKIWRQKIRTELSIPENYTVYTYSGSAKPWQCAAETLFYFSQRYKENNNSLLLILTTDVEYFQRLCTSTKVPKTHYRVLRTKPELIYEYLAAANIGLIFRHADIINWVSRPTKALEYQAVGLEVVHNHTIAWLEKKTEQTL